MQRKGTDHRDGLPLLTRLHVCIFRMAAYLSGKGAVYGAPDWQAEWNSSRLQNAAPAFSLRCNTRVAPPPAARARRIFHNLGRAGFSQSCRTRMDHRFCSPLSSRRRESVRPKQPIARVQPCCQKVWTRERNDRPRRRRNQFSRRSVRTIRGRTVPPNLSTRTRFWSRKNTLSTRRWPRRKALLDRSRARAFARPREGRHREQKHVSRRRLTIAARRRAVPSLRKVEPKTRQVVGRTLPRWESLEQGRT